MEIKTDILPIWEMLKQEKTSAVKSEQNNRSSYELGLSVKSTLSPTPKEHTNTKGGGCCSHGGGSVHCVTQGC